MSFPLGIRITLTKTSFLIAFLNFSIPLSPAESPSKAKLYSRIPVLFKISNCFADPVPRRATAG